MRAAALAVAALLLIAVPAQARFGDLSPRLVRLTDRRYDHDCFWGGPRGAGYGELPGAQEIQKANLYPDTGATYFAGQFQLPAGASLRFDGRFPHARYMSYAIQTQLGGGELGAGDVLRDEQIRALRGSVNPYVRPHRRDAHSRRYAMRVVGGAAPAREARNTLYTGTTDPDAQVVLVLRHYIPDVGRDGTGGAGLPRLTLRQADGTRLRGQAACGTLRTHKDQATVTFPASLWKSLVAASSDPVNDPAPDPPRWERFWNVGYSVFGVFVKDREERLRRYPPSDDGAFAPNPDTRYLTTGVSLRLGRVYTVTGRMPRYPRTLPARTRLQPYDVRYWSVCTGSAPTSGLGYDCVFDQQVTLRHRRYRIVVSTPADRPRNARAACGYTWLDFGRGENHPDATGRTWQGVMYMRFMNPRRAWSHAPQRMEASGTEAAVMGPYLPRGAYTSTRAFERRGCGRS
jgi:hypothetical protein